MVSSDLFLRLHEYVSMHLQKPANHITDSVYERERRDEPDAESPLGPFDNAEKLNIAGYVRSRKKPSFNKVLFEFIDKKGVSDSDIYKRAGIDRRLFSKIRSVPDYHPSKDTVAALALALELGRKDAAKLFYSAGYALSDSNIRDLVISFCLENEIFCIDDVNAALEYFGLKPLC
jgi:hypothetical protein